MYLKFKRIELYDDCGWPLSVTENEGYDINGFPASRHGTCCVKDCESNVSYLYMANVLMNDGTRKVIHITSEKDNLEIPTLITENQLKGLKI